VRAIEPTVAARAGARREQYPTIRVTGDARERGRSYGSQAADRIAIGIAGYERALRHFAGWEWPRVREEASRFSAPIAASFPRYVEEMRGIAEGAGVAFEDILALNVRTEIMFAGQVRTAEGSSPPAECTAIGALPTATGATTLIAQNWDWFEHCFDTVVVLEADASDGLRFASVVEAGMLAKTGMNEAGLGVCTNALVTSRDVGEPGIPYHVILRAFMDCRTPSEAIALATRERRSSSANYLIGHADGILVDLEAEPGGPHQLHVRLPDGDGLLVHTNHFLTGDVRPRDLSVWSMPDSPIRLDRVRRFLQAHPGPFTDETAAAALSDHGNFPSAICCHPDPAEDEVNRGATVVSVIMDVGAHRLLVADGNPCVAPYREHDLAPLFGDAGRLDLPLSGNDL
jgi:isopenicillin-N N-acyltransferase-like protein